ncbi:hypothetical protein [Paenibacillus popilliae]|uniref:Transposase and inactivated derivative n=1 Tax=Paenibacillus popilliae ATCC 14706 TaxID=1212764 RepID=M9M6Y7_PAEPP|nr:hypothetical protein [Paenibacillus popilliae]GAC43393.1 transposase and inactivated derivative [Paenibacillus popilliae ATCC 14706]
MRKDNTIWYDSNRYTVPIGTYEEVIRKQKPRYIRDQLQAIEKYVSEASAKTADQALAYCLKHSLYRAADFADAVSHYIEKAQQQADEKPTQSDLKLLAQVDPAKLKAKPQIRPFQTYERILEGG